MLKMILKPYFILNVQIIIWLFFCKKAMGVLLFVWYYLLNNFGWYFAEFFVSDNKIKQKKTKLIFLICQFPQNLSLQIYNFFLLRFHFPKNGRNNKNIVYMKMGNLVVYLRQAETSINGMVGSWTLTTFAFVYL